MSQPARAQVSLVIAEKKSGAARYVTRFVGRDGKILAEVPGSKPTYRLRGNEKYVRASVLDSKGNRAWTQSVFLDDRKVHP